ncbi:MAG: TetR/AcrR family transcriptional regulator [Myxococcota bacterium]
MPRPTFFNLPADKRARLVELAIDEFAGHPFGEASISRIVAGAGIAKGSFYQYFDDKLDLFRWLLVHEITGRKIAFLATRPLPDTTRVFTLLEHLVVVGLQFGLANPRLARVALLAGQRSPDPALSTVVTEWESNGRAQVRELLERAQRTGELRPDVDLELAVDLVQVVLRHGLDVVMRRRFGFDVWEVCTDPDRTLTEEQARSVAADVIGGLRDGIGTNSAEDAS